MTGLVQDFRFSLRQLRKSPGFTAVAVITLALGIGANTAIFSVVNGALLRALPFQDPDRLVRIWHVPPPKSFPGMTFFAVSAANYIDWERQNHVFQQMAICSFRGFTLTGTQTPEQVQAVAVSPGFFSTLGVQPMLGRVFSGDEDQPGRSQVVVLSHRFWQERFGSNADIVGHNISLDGQGYLVAGVMPPSFRMPDTAQLWTPMAWTDQERAVRGEHHYMVIARLKPGVDGREAQAEMSTISDRLQQQYPADDKGWGAVVRPLHDDLVSDVRPALLVLSGAVAFVLLIACVNVANLALAKTLSRQKEIAIRSALGASAVRVLRQILTETVLLALTGGAIGLVFAHFGIRLIMAFLADKLPPSVEVSLDSRVFAFTAVISILAGIVAGVLPAVRLTGKDLNSALKRGMRGTDSDSDSDSDGHRTRGILVVAEVALSVVLLFGAGLMIRSFHQLQTVNPGFEPQGVLTMTVSVSNAKFPSPAGQVRFFDQVLQRVKALPGVESAGVIDTIPLSGNGSNQPIAIEGRPVLPMSEQPEVDVRLVSPQYMDAMRIPIVRGRNLADTDVAGRQSVILISQSMAKQFWPGEDPVGKRLTLQFFPEPVREVVGVVGDVKDDGMDQTRPAATLYVPLAQTSASTNGGWTSFSMTLAVRSVSNPSGLVSAVSNSIHSVDPEIPLKDILTMENLVNNSMSQRRFNMLLLGAFAGLALLLAAIGIYSVLSYSVKRRVQEIGIRLALGARIGDVLRMVVVEGMKPTLLGVVVGIIGAFALGRVLSTLIYGVKSTDLVTFLAVSVVLSIVALFASIIPAYRAAKVDPMVAVRYE